MNLSPAKQYGLMLPSMGMLLILGFVFFSKPAPKEKFHIHAGFAVFADDKKLDFSESKYMYTEPCSEDKKDENSPENIQVGKAHLHNNVGDVIHIEQPGGVWKDLFTNIGFSIEFQNTKGFINGKEVANYQDKNINKDDVLVVFIGQNDIEKSLSQAPTVEYIEETGTNTKTCSE